MAGKRKRVKHYHEPRDVHELTFSCYRRLPLLTNDTWRGYLAASVQDACEQHRFRLVAFVFMPEHVHLLVLPESQESEIGAFLAAVKRPCSVQVNQGLLTGQSPLLDKLTVRERRANTAFRFSSTTSPFWLQSITCITTRFGVGYVARRPTGSGPVLDPT
jgi:putative transposase